MQTVQMDERELESIAERIREISKKEEAEMEDMGHQAGMWWAKKEASKAQLRRLEENGEDFEAGEPCLPLTRLGALMQTACPHLDSTEANERMTELFEADEVGNVLHFNDDEQVAIGKGFLRGAMEVWYAVKARV